MASTDPTAASPVWHPFTQHGLGVAPVEIVETDGAYLVTRDRRRILDAISSWWVTTHGHRHPRIVAAITEAAQRLDQVIFAGFTHAPAEDLARALIEVAPRPGRGGAPLAHVFYSDSGSTAVEVGLKMALGHWRNLGMGHRTRILALDHAYHGDTVGTMSVGARGVFSAACTPLLFEVGRLPFPSPGCEDDTLARLDTAARAGNVAALLIEPLILGAGGMLTYPPGQLVEMRALCDRHGVLLIVDEVMTGWGRTGTLWACQQAGIAPDILCTGKGLTGGSLPLAATLATSAVFGSHRSDDRARMLFHSSSYTANPMACAAALANIAIWREEPVAARIAGLCAAQERARARFAGDPRFTSVRRCGTILALDLAVADAGYLAGAAPEMMAFALERDVLLRPLGNTLYVMPPYATTAADLSRVEDLVDALATVFAAGRPV